MEKEKHIGKNVRSIRQLKGMKQATFAKELGIAQQNVSKMENKKELSDKQIEQAAKVLQTTTEAIKNFDEDRLIQNFLFNDQTFNYNPLEKVIELYERLLNDSKNDNEKLRKELEKYKIAKIKTDGSKKKGEEGKLKSVPIREERKVGR